MQTLYLNVPSMFWFFYWLYKRRTNIPFDLLYLLWQRYFLCYVNVQNVQVFFMFEEHFFSVMWIGTRTSQSIIVINVGSAGWGKDSVVQKMVFYQ